MKSSVNLEIKLLDRISDWIKAQKRDAFRLHGLNKPEDGCNAGYLVRTSLIILVMPCSRHHHHLFFYYFVCVFIFW